VEAQSEDIVALNPRGFATEPEDDDFVSFVPMAAIEELSGRLNPTDLRMWSTVKKGYTRFQNGDVVLAKITPCMENGKFAVAKGLHGGRAAGTTELHVLRPTTAVVPEYLFHFFAQEGIRRDARAHMQGAAGQLRVPSKYVASARIPLPPLAEQHRIVAAIEEHLSRLDAAVAGLGRVQALLPRYRAVVLKAAVEGSLVAAEGGSWRGFSCL
jgi:type I restriction enzyme S subunit